MRRIVPLLIFSAALISAQNLGRIDFPTSVTGKAQEHFIRGVLLLHSFEYADAQEEFQKARELNPNFAMAYWGEALTFTHPVWVEQDLARGRDALARLAATPALRQLKAATQREKDYLAAVERLYGEGDKPARDKAYAAAMFALTQRYPADLEAAAFYSVALLGTCEGKRDFSTYMRAAAASEEVFAKNPEHPGAVHYLIHAYDDPVHAPLGLRPARVYGNLAGAASHALHMPSHIFFALGMWEEANATNQKSIAVADARVERKSLSPDARNYHSLLWLEYGYLQQGSKANARRVFDDLAVSARQTMSARAMAHLAFASAAWTTETGEAESLPLEVWDKAPAEAAVARLTSQGILAAQMRDSARAQTLYEAAALRLQHMHDATPSEVHGSMPMTPTHSNEAASGIMLDELRAAILWQEDKKKEALSVATAAAKREDAITFEFGPPIPAKPAHEFLADLLLQSGSPKEAEAEYQRALARAPRRHLSLRGLQKAASEAGDTATAEQAAADLRSFWRGY